MKQNDKRYNMKKLIRVKYAKKVHVNSALECTSGNGPSVDGLLYTGHERLLQKKQTLAALELHLK